MIRLFIFLLLLRLAIAIDESPIASFACQLCSAGSPLISTILPPKTTCADLDLAMQNIGRGGCSGLNGVTQGGTIPGIDPNNATQVWEYALQLQTSLTAEQVYAYRLLLAVIGLAVTLVVVIVVAIVIIYFIFKKEVEDEAIATYSKGLFPTAHVDLKFL